LTLKKTRNTFCGTWYLPHGIAKSTMTELLLIFFYLCKCYHIMVNKDVYIIMAGCIAHARNGRIPHASHLIVTLSRITLTLTRGT